jgi:SAM-dependent methyltransferase
MAANEFDLNDPRVVDVYDDLTIWSAVVGQFLLRHLPLDANAKVLDVGCGTGFPAVELAQRLGPTAHVTGIDLWAAALARAGRKAKVWGVGNVTFIDGDATSMPFPENSFELIVSNLGLNTTLPIRRQRWLSAGELYVQGDASRWQRIFRAPWRNSTQYSEQCSPNLQPANSTPTLRTARRFLERSPC